MRGLLFLLALGSTAGCATLPEPPPEGSALRVEVEDARLRCPDRPLPPLDLKARIGMNAAIADVYGVDWAERFRVVVQVHDADRAEAWFLYGSREFAHAEIEVKVERVDDGGPWLHARGSAQTEGAGKGMSAFPRALYQAVRGALLSRAPVVPRPLASCTPPAPVVQAPPPLVRPPHRRTSNTIATLVYAPTVGAEGLTQGGGGGLVHRQGAWDLFAMGVARQGPSLPGAQGEQIGFELLAYAGFHHLWPLDPSITLYAGGGLGISLWRHTERSADFRKACPGTDTTGCLPGTGAGTLAAVRRTDLLLIGEVGARADLLSDDWIVGPFVELGLDVGFPTESTVISSDGGPGAAARAEALRAQLDDAGPRLGLRLSAGLVIGY